MTKYKGSIWAYDIVNEPLNSDGTIKSTFWTQVLGTNVFNIAFGAARQADALAKVGPVNIFLSDDSLIHELALRQ